MKYQRLSDDALRAKFEKLFQRMSETERLALMGHLNAEDREAVKSLLSLLAHKYGV